MLSCFCFPYKNQIFKMSEKNQKSSKESTKSSRKKLLFCEACKVACVTEERLKLHKESEKHILVRKDSASSKAFVCRLCKHSGNLKYMMKHITCYKHSISYMAKHHRYLFPLFKNFQPYHARSFQVKTHATCIERKEAISRKGPVNEPEEGVFKNDFDKYTIELHEKCAEKAKLKQDVMEYLNNFAIESQEEEEVVKKLKDQLEQVINVFCQYSEDRTSKTRNEPKPSKEETSVLPSKRKYVWDEKLPSKVPRVSSSHSETDGESCASEDQKLDLQDFVTEEQDESENAQGSPSTSSLSDTKVTGTNDSADLSKAGWVTTKETLEDHPLKRPLVTQSKSTGIPSSNTNKADQKISSGSWGSKLPKQCFPSLFDSLNASPEEENNDNEKAKKRRQSTEILATFTLFSQGKHSSSIKGRSSDVVKNDHGLHRMIPSSSVLHPMKSKSPKKEDLPQITKQSNPLHEHLEVLETNPDEELDHQSNLKYNQCHSDLESNPDEHIILDEYTDEYNECGNESAQLGSMLQSAQNTSSPEHSYLKDTLDGQIEGQDNPFPADNLASPPVSKPLRKINPGVLQLLKGKDVNEILSLLKTVSPYYEELQQLDLADVAEVVSETGTLG
uniref:Uncharacterized protein n=1 Tax=Leptobrachium leishanense TaxID=445787 RepID=A0A8C5M6A3_9ANUR